MYGPFQSRQLCVLHACVDSVFLWHIVVVQLVLGIMPLFRFGQMFLNQLLLFASLKLGGTFIHDDVIIKCC